MAQQREQKTKRNKQVMVNNFKGMETLIDSSGLGLDVADMALNVSWDTDGGISRREGSKEVHDNGQEEINFFIKKKVGIVDATDVSGISTGAVISKGVAVHAKITTLKGDSGFIKGAKTLGVMAPLAFPGNQPGHYYAAFIKDDNFHGAPFRLPITGNYFQDSRAKTLTSLSNYIAHVDNMGGLVNLVYLWNNNKLKYTFSNDKDEFVEYTNISGTHDLPDSVLKTHRNIISNSSSKTLWMGVEQGNKDKLWSVYYRDGDLAIRVETPSGEIRSIGVYDNSNDVDNSHIIRNGHTGAYNLVNIGSETVLTYIDTHNVLATPKSHRIHKLYKMHTNGNKSIVDFGEGDDFSLMSHIISPDGKIIALFVKETADLQIEDMKIIELSSDGVTKTTHDAKLIKDSADASKSMMDKFNSYQPKNKRHLITMFTTENASSYTVNFSVLHISSDISNDDLYTRQDSPSDSFVLDFANKTYTMMQNTRIESCIRYGVQPIESWHPRAMYDAFSDRVILLADHKSSFSNDYLARAVEIPKGTKIFSVGVPTLSGPEYASKIPKIIYVLDEGKNKIGEITQLKSDHLVHDVSGEGWAKSGEAKYFVVKENMWVLNYISIHTAVEDDETTNLRIKSAIKTGKKKIGELLDITVIVSKNGTLSVLDKDKKTIEIYYGKSKSNFIKIDDFVNYKTEDLSWTYINDSIIISTPNDSLVITGTVVKDTGNTTKPVIYINTIFDLADKITYSQALESGLNRLSEFPLNIIKTEKELIGPVNLFDDIILTEPITPADKAPIALSIAPNKEYHIHPQVFVDEKDKYTKTYTWKLFKLSRADYQWSEITDGIDTNSNPNAIILKPLAIETEYRIECTATATHSSEPAKSSTLTKSLTFNVSGKSVSFTDGANSVYEEIKKCKYVATLDGRLAFYGNGTRQIYTSEIDNPFYFTSSEAIVADAFGKSEDIISIDSFKDTHVIFTNTTMMSMTRVYPEKAESFWSVLPLDGVVGAVGHRAVTPIENSLAFVSDEGVYIIGQISVAEKRVQLIPISSSIRDKTTTFRGDKTRMTNINVANIEKRIFISFPDKKYVAVYDYNAAESITAGKWAIWDNIVPRQMEIHDFDLYFTNFEIQDDPSTLINESADDGTSLHNTKIYVKNKRVYLDLHELDGDETYFTDSGNVYDFEYTSKNSALSEPMMYKKIKRISITADNWIKDDAKYDVTTMADYQPDWDNKVDNITYKKPNLNKTGFLKLGKTMTTWRKSENIKTITNMKAKKGTVLNISIKNNSKGPISIKRIYIEYVHSNIRRFKSN